MQGEEMKKHSYVVSAVGIKQNLSQGNNQDAIRLCICEPVDAISKEEAVGKMLAEIIIDFTKNGFTFSVAGAVCAK